MSIGLYSQAEICTLTQPDLAAVNEPQATVITSDQRQYIFPNTRFEGCNGTITRLNFVASDFDASENVNPEIQLWENIGGTMYQFVSGSSITIDVQLLNGSPERKYYSYDVNPGVSFQPGYVLGVFTPRSQDSRLKMNFQTSSAGQSYYIGTTQALRDMQNFDSNLDSAAPLISVEIVTNGELTFYRYM